MNLACLWSRERPRATKKNFFLRYQTTNLTKNSILLLVFTKRKQSDINKFANKCWEIHCVKYQSPETLRKLSLSTKFPHQEIRCNYSILCSVYNYSHIKCLQNYQSYIKCFKNVSIVSFASQCLFSDHFKTKTLNKKLTKCPQQIFTNYTQQIFAKEYWLENLWWSFF